MTDLYASHAKHYDAAYAAKPDLVDTPFYLDFVGRHGGPVLEIACGTGRVLLEIAKRGVPIVGIDSSDAQLDVLRQKLQALPAEVRRNVEIQSGDMRTFDLGRQFRSVIIPFRPLQHMHTVDDQLAALSRARAHLASDGLLVFDLFYPSYKLLGCGPTSEVLDFEWTVPEHPNRRVQRYFVRHHVDQLNQRFDAEFIFRTLDGDRIILEERAPLSMTWFTYPQMQLLFRQTGLEIVEEYGSFQKDPIEVCKEMIFVLRAV